MRASMVRSSVMVPPLAAYQTSVWKRGMPEPSCDYVAGLIWHASHRSVFQQYFELVLV